MLPLSPVVFVVLKGWYFGIVQVQSFVLSHVVNQETIEFTNSIQYKVTVQSIQSVIENTH